MGIDLDEISWTVTFPCGPDLHFFCSRSLNNFGQPLCLSLLSFILMITDIILCMFIDLDQIFSTSTFVCDPDLDFLVHLSRRFKCTIVITRCPSSVRLSVVNFSHFRLLIWNHWTEFNETWQEARSQHPLPSCVFRADRKNKMAALASDLLRHFRLLIWNRWTEFNETWLEARFQRPLPSLCFSGRSEKQDGRPGLWLAETFSTSHLKPLNRIQRNLRGSKISTSSTKFVFFGPIGKTRWPPWPLIGWDIFDFSSETSEQNSTKLDWKKDLNVLYQVCVFRADRKNKMAALASDWLRHFRLLLWNYWTEFNEIWQEARSQRPLPSLCFSGRSEKQDGHPGLWLAETFLTFPLKPLNRIQRNLTGSKISTSSTKFVFFGPIGKTRWPPWPLIGWDIFDFTSETTEQNSKKLDRKQDLNVLYQVCVFLGRSEKQDGRPGLWLAETFLTFPLKLLNRIQWNLTDSKISTSSTKFCVFCADCKNKMAALVFDWLRYFRLLWNGWTEFNESWQEARCQHPLPSLCFSGQSEKQDGHPGLWLAETFLTSLKPLNGIQTKLDRKQDLNVLYQFCIFRADQ